MTGYDILQGNPDDEGEDPGFRNKIFEPTVKNEQNHYALASGITVIRKLFLFIRQHLNYADL